MKAVSLLSGGIDSPVASCMMMRQGYDVVLVHVFNETGTGNALSSKMERLAKQLSKYQKNVKMYVVPFGKIQRQIIIYVPPKLRMLVYRRFMVRIANAIAKKEKASAIITGDSLAQVASQTMENLSCVYAASELPIMSPLIGFGKAEIIDTAKKIGTYDISILPYDDCCSFMIAQHPETHARLDDVLDCEYLIQDADRMVEDAAGNAKVKTS